MLFKVWQKMKLRKKREKEDFNARMQMESTAQKQVDKRLTALEITLRNQGRIK